MVLEKVDTVGVVEEGYVPHRPVSLFFNRKVLDGQLIEERLELISQNVIGPLLWQISEHDFHVENFGDGLIREAGCPSIDSKCARRYQDGQKRWEKVTIMKQKAWQKLVVCRIRAVRWGRGTGTRQFPQT